MSDARLASSVRAVVVCTARRGVFFGYTSEPLDVIIDRRTVALARPRMCVYWSAATRGILGLAAIGPQEGSRISMQPPEMTVNEITAVIVCSDEARDRWEAGPWS